MLGYIRHRISIKYLLATGIAITAIFVVLYFWLAHKHKAFIMAQVEKQAVILHRQIVLTRQWVSDHGYVLVADDQARPGAASASASDLTGALHGTAYTRITPALLTRRLSDYAASQNLYAFHLTNLSPRNPQNRPDAFEARAISLFRDESRDSISRVDQLDGRRFFRYAAPLVVQESCLACHGRQGFAVGDIGGCISVLIPFDETYQAIRDENFSLFMAMVGLTLGVVLVLFFLTQNLIFGPIRDIRRFTQRMRGESSQPTEGDELNEFKKLCYVLDGRLRRRHSTLARQIADATRELEKANKELTHLNEAKNTFLADVSHELRTPLTSIKGAVDYLARKGGWTDTDSTYLNIIRKNTEHVIRTVVDFIDYARIENGHLELAREPVDLTILASEVVSAIQADAAAKNLSITLGMVPDVEILADGRRIYQVMANLLTNAIKFSPDRGAISVLSMLSGRMACVVVRDSGTGVPEEQRERIFQKFYQLSVSRPSPGSRRASSGIGLAICKGLVEAHGGQIWYEARPEGGSDFCFTVPLNVKRKDVSDAPILHPRCG